MENGKRQRGAEDIGQRAEDKASNVRFAPNDLSDVHGARRASNFRMRFRALATDYDETLATHGRVESATIAGLKRLHASGRRLLLVTGRELPDVKRIFPEIATFDAVVAENGAVLYLPSSARETLLCEPPSEALIAALRESKVPISVGRGIIATTEPHQVAVLNSIHELGLELQVIFNKGAVMVLPSGINKATGLGHALRELAIAAENTVAIGDAENDHAFLAACGCGVAVANALASLKSHAHVVTVGSQGAGVLEVIEELLANDFVRCASRGGRAS
jgi:HAD superfamily hydrolase (TIGR01484 family)